MGWGAIGEAFSKAADVVDSVADSVADHTVSAFNSAMDFADDVGESISEASFSDIGHTVLDVAGMVPVLGEAADLANAGWYAAEGDYQNAALSMAAVIPFAGGAATAAKWGSRAVDTATDVAKAVDTANDVTRAADTARDTARATNNVTGTGNYNHLVDHPSVGPGKPFTQTQKGNILEANMERNNGVLRSDISGEELVRPQQHTRGVTPPGNEAHIDHVIERSQGGANSYENARVLSRTENLSRPGR